MKEMERGNLRIGDRRVRLFVCAFLAVFLVFVSVSGCKREKETVPEVKKLKVLASFLPMYIFTANVVKGVREVDLDILLPPEGSGPHGYNLTPGDMKKLSEADVLVINGLMLEAFLDDAVKAGKPDMKVIVASDGIETIPDVREEEEGGGHNGEGHEHGSANPHVWLSPSRAIVEVRNITEGLAKVDPDNADFFRQNAEIYIEQLVKLDEKYKSAVKEFKNKKIVTVHNAFDYLAADIGIEVIAVLRMDPTASPRPAELAKIVALLRKEKPAGIFIEPQFAEKLANVLSEETKVPIFTLDPIATGELRDDYYIEAMHSNLSSLQEAMR